MLDLKYRVAVPKSETCDLRLTGLTVKEIIPDGAGNVTVSFSGGRGFANVAGKGLVPFQPVVFRIEHHFNDDEDAEAYLICLRRWFDEGAVLRLYSDPNKQYARLMKSHDDWMPVPRPAGVR